MMTSCLETYAYSHVQADQNNISCPWIKHDEDCDGIISYQFDLKLNMKTFNTYLNNILVNVLHGFNICNKRTKNQLEHLKKCLKECRLYQS